MNRALRHIRTTQSRAFGNNRIKSTLLSYICIFFTFILFYFQILFSCFFFLRFCSLVHWLVNASQESVCWDFAYTLCVQVCIVYFIVDPAKCICAETVFDSNNHNNRRVVPARASDLSLARDARTHTNILSHFCWVRRAHALYICWFCAVLVFIAQFLYHHFSVSLIFVVSPF